MIPEIPLAQSILQILKAYQIKHIVISPGSRNAPLTIGFASDKAFQCYSIVDERCAGFFALGIAQQTKEPVVLVCTSGSAVLNYHPAIAEAFYSQIPLIVLSADRPLDKIDIGDGQTIRQENVLANHTVYDVNLTADASQLNDDLIQKALHECMYKKAPVHINVPFEEPLYNTLSNYTYTPNIQIYIHDKITPILDKNIVKKWTSSTKKMVLIGVHPPHEISDEMIKKLGEDNSVLVFTEITSNVHHPNFISHIDTLIASFTDEEKKEFCPDILVTMGGMVISKHIKKLLRNLPIKEHWHIDELRHYDTFSKLTDAIEIQPEQFLQQVYKENHSIESHYQSIYIEKLKKKVEKGKKYLENIPFSDLKVFELLSKHLTSNIDLQISNSAGIRYALLFDFQKNIQVFCNRGTSGIDGSTTTAIGAAVASNRPTTLITGDISFFYDSNALWNQYIPKHFKIILVNNSGGGIFRILPGHQESEVFKTYFETSHNLTAKHLAEMYNFQYITAKNEEEVINGISTIYQTEQPIILEIFTPEKINQDIQRNYFKSVKGDF